MSESVSSHQSVMPPLPAQQWVLAVMALFPERRGPKGEFVGVLTRPWNTAQALDLLQGDGLFDADEVRREIMLLRASAVESDTIYKLARASLLCARAHAAYFFTMDEAWATALDCARTLQKQCGGWFSMAEACLRGMRHHLGEAISEEARNAFYALHASEHSPWNKVQWRTLLAGELPAPGEQGAILEAHDSEELRALLKEAPAGALIQLHPNRYEGPFEIRQVALTLKGGTDVVLSLPDSASGPLLDVDGAIELRDLILRANTDTLIKASGPFLRVEGCELEGGELGLEVQSDYVQVVGSTFRSLGRAGVLDCRRARLLELRFSEDIGRGFEFAPRCDACLADDLELSSQGPALVFANQDEGKGARFVMNRSRIHQGLIHLEHLSEVHLSESRLDGGLWLMRCVAHVESCHLGSDNKVHGGKVGFHQCHFLNAEHCNLELAQRHHTLLVGGQLGQVQQAGSNIRIEGGWTRLERTSLGPSQGHNLVFSQPNEDELARLELDDVVCSAAQLDAVVMQGQAYAKVGVQANKLRIRNAVGSGLRLEGVRGEIQALDVADVSGEQAITLKQSSLHVCGLGLRGVHNGVVASGGSCVVLVDVALGALEDTFLRLQDEQTRLACVAHDAELNAHINQGAFLALRGAKLKSKALLVEEASVELDTLTLPVHGLELKRSRAQLNQVQQEEDAIVLDENSELKEMGPQRSGTAMSPLLVTLKPEPFKHWGFQAQPRHLVVLAEWMARRLGYEGRLGVRETPKGLRVDGPLPLVAKFSPHFDSLMRQPGALGLALAEVLSGLLKR